MNFRAQFPVFKADPKLVYLDSGATTLKLESVINLQHKFLLTNGTSNHSLTHHLGYAANEAVEATRKAVQELIKAPDMDEVIFTSGTTASLNQVAFGMANQIKKGDEIWLTILEHGANLLPWIEIAKRQGATLKFLPLDKNGLIDASQLSKLFTSKVKIVTFAHASNTLGGLNPVKAIVDAAKKANPKSLIVLDAAQTIAHAPVDVQKMGIDFLAFSGHKMYGPFGVGVLWGQEKWLKIMDPLLYGGGMNITIDPENMSYERMPLPAVFEGGTPNIDSIIALKPAIDFIRKIGFKEIQSHEHDLKDYFRGQVTKNNLKEKITFYNLDNEAPMVLFNAKKWAAQDVATFLDVKYHIAVRDGEHCARLTSRYLGIGATVRASFGIYNNHSDIDALVEALKNIDKALEVF